ncbi:MAG: heavy-metal-associated domain-containing protein [Microthrixaceae bacterium]
MSTTTKINVDGMSCGHCVTSVTNEVRKLDGVKGVDVDLAAGTVQITSDAPLDEADVNAALDEAGYEVRT